MLDILLPVKELMTENVYTVKTGDVMTAVDQLFTEHSIHHVPVVNEIGEVEGIISKSDYYRLQHGFTLFKTKQSVSYNEAVMRSLFVRDVMTTPVVSMLPTDSIAKAAEIFRENVFHAIPVVDENKQLLGIVTTYDLLTYAYK